MGLKQRVVGITGSLSGVTSIFGSWQVCHTICLGLVGALGILGITVTGMPLLFLTRVALPAWLIAAALFAITLSFYLVRRCIPPSLLLFNAGILIAGVPFAEVGSARPLFWATGGLIALGGVVLFIRQKINRRKNHGKP